MARRSSIGGLPETARRWLDRALVEGNFSGYDKLVAELASRGYTISKSAAHRYGQKVERRLAAIKAATEAAKLMADAAPDDQDARSSALTAMIQTELFEAMINLREATDEGVDAEERAKLLSIVAKNIATLTRSSVNLKQYQADARREAAKEAAQVATTAAVDAGATEEQVAFIRARILGIEDRFDG